MRSDANARFCEQKEQYTQEGAVISEMVKEIDVRREDFALTNMDRCGLLVCALQAFVHRHMTSWRRWKEGMEEDACTREADARDPLEDLLSTPYRLRASCLMSSFGSVVAPLTRFTRCKIVHSLNC